MQLAKNKPSNREGYVLSMKKNLCFIACVFFMTVGIFAQTLDQIVESGKAAYNRGDYNRAIAEYTEAIRNAPVPGTVLPF